MKTQQWLIETVDEAYRFLFPFLFILLEDPFQLRRKSSGSNILQMDIDLLDNPPGLLNETQESHVQSGPARPGLGSKNFGLALSRVE